MTYKAFVFKVAYSAFSNNLEDYERLLISPWERALCPREKKTLSSRKNTADGKPQEHQERSEAAHSGQEWSCG